MAKTKIQKKSKTSKELIKLRIENLSDADRQVLRLRSIEGRHVETDAIQELEIYATAHGSQNAKRYYSLFTNMTYKAIFDISDIAKQTKKLRDLMSGIQLCHLTTAESIVAKIIREDIAKEIYYREIYKHCQNELIKFGAMIRISAIPQYQLQIPQQQYSLLN